VVISKRGRNTRFHFMYFLLSIYTDCLLRRKEEFSHFWIDIPPFVVCLLEIIEK